MKNDGKGDTPRDKRETKFEVGMTVVETNKLMKVKSIKGDDLEVTGADNKVSTVKMGDVTNIAVSA
ncbi:MAG: hypothetical protein HQK96_18485 [Nitrospirae bacterium]|nr:hypothetical protein [Nitrospirota bacterium]